MLRPSFAWSWRDEWEPNNRLIVSKLRTARELREGATQTEDTSFCLESLKKPEIKRGTKWKPVSRSMLRWVNHESNALKAQSDSVCHEAYFYIRCASAFVCSFFRSWKWIQVRWDRGEEHVQSRTKVYKYKEVLN